MLEIIILYKLTKNIGNIAVRKGYKPGLYKFLTVIFWIFFEVTGALIGVLFLGEGLMTYVCALLGAIVGYLLIYLIVSCLASKIETDMEILDAVE